MKKIAIMTWLFYGNFGSILQAYSLGKYLSEQGNYIEYINYYPNSQYPRPLVDRLRDKEDVKRKVRSVIRDHGKVQNPDLSHRLEIMNNFIAQNFILTEKCETNSELHRLSNGFDAVIAGSDQIWSPLVFDEKFYLSYLGSKVKKISYAPSFGVNNIDNSNLCGKIGKLIDDFDYVSVREDSGKNIVSKLCNKEATVVVDPTLLLSKTEWHAFAEEYTAFDTKTEYLLAYFLGDNKRYEKYLKWAKKNGLRVVLIPSKVHNYCCEYEVTESLTPEQFVYLFEHAKCVCTDSFHGTVFSIIFNRPFLTLARFDEKSKINQNERLRSLLSLTGLGDRYCDAFSIMYCKKLGEQYNVKVDLDERIAASKYFLQKAVLEEKAYKSDGKVTITQNCSGCGVCLSICPRKAITIRKNTSGFYYAEINDDKCVKCGLCIKVCGFNSKCKIIDDNVTVLAVREKDIKSLMKSASGGFATALSKFMLEKGFSIIGCKYDSTINEAIHAVAKDEKVIEEFRSSKYLQSHLDKCLLEHRINEKAVVIGTPCQIASLHSMLTIKGVRDDYFLVDLICHGVPSYNMWHKYLKYIIHSMHSESKVSTVCFRKKISKKTNQNMNMEIVSSDKVVITPKVKDVYLKMFCLGNSYNLSCYNCNFRNYSSADLRIGDYWGENFKEYPGTSMVIVMTKRGDNIINQMYKLLDICDGDIQDYRVHQQIVNTNPPDYYNELMMKLADTKINIKEIYREYCNKYYCLDPIKKIIRIVFH